VGNVSEAPINHAKAIEVSILCITHLAKPKVIAIWIDRLHTPIAFLCDQCVETLEFFVINNP
jgi:hypothetical protein